MLNIDKENKDILDSKKVEKKLKESREKYRFLFEESHLSIFLMDMNNKFVDCNSTVEKTFGYTKEDLENRI